MRAAKNKKIRTPRQPAQGSDFSVVVDPKGIEPSNLTDANRALSQLSYGPLSLLPVQNNP